MTDAQLKPGWKIYKFGDIAENVAVRVDPSEAETDVYVGLEHLDPSTLHLRQWGHPSDVTGQKLVFKKGDVIFGRRRAYQRKLAVAEFNGICSAHAMVVRAIPKMVLPFFLQSDMFMERAIEISVGSLSPTINWKTLRVQEFPLPPLDEQKRFADILWAADESAVRWNDSLGDISGVTEATIDSFIYDSDGKTSRWPLVKLSNHVEESLYGPRFPAGQYSPEGNAYTIRTTDFDRVGGIEYSDVPAANLEENVVSRHLLQDGDFLLSRSGEYAGLGAVFRVQDNGHAYIPAAFLIRFRLCESLLPDYLMALFSSKFHRLHVLPLAKGSAQPNISGSKALDLLIPTPPITEQKQLLRQLAEIKGGQEELRSHLNRVITGTKGLIDFFTTGAPCLTKKTLSNRWLSTRSAAA